MSVAGFRQVLAVTCMSVVGLPKRVGPSLVIVISIAGVVTVLISVLAMVAGFVSVADRTGRPDRVIVVSRGALTEADSRLLRDSLVPILDAPGVKKSTDGKPLAAAEALVPLRLTDPRTELDTFATVRGTGSRAFTIRPEVHLMEGRMFRPGLHEMIVGRGLQRRLGLEVGASVPLAQADWRIVGAFTSAGDSHESELVTDSETLLSSMQRNFFNDVTLMLDSSERFDALKAALNNNPAIAVSAERETDYFKAAYRPMASMLRMIASVIGLIMALGAVFATANAMYSAVSARLVEIATLRALGFNGSSVVISILLEAQLLALVGAVMGAAIAWYFFNGNSVSTTPSDSPAPVTYALSVSFPVIASGIVTACLIGLLAGVFPAVRAARTSIAEAIRG